jgi:virginiamycin B lyase
VILGGIVLTLALLGTLLVAVILPATGCPKAPAGAPAGAVSDYCFAPFLGGSHQVGGLAAGPDGALWFTEGAHIGRLTPGGDVTEFALPAGDSASGPILVGPDNNLWFVEDSTVALGRLTPNGAEMQIPLPAGSLPAVALATGPDGAIWYARSAASVGGPQYTPTAGVIGRMTLSGAATEFSLPTPPASPATGFTPPPQPRGLVTGPDGALWFYTGSPHGAAQVQTAASWIGRITTSGQASVVYTPDPLSLAGISSIAAGPDGNLWFTVSTSAANLGGGPQSRPTSSVGRLTPSGSVQLFALASSLGSASAITASPDGALWVAAAKIARITTSGQVSAFTLPDANAEIGAVAGGPGKAVWFVQTYPDTDPLNSIVWGVKIGRVNT